METILSLGSNLGDRKHHLEEALRELRALPETRVVAIAPLYETEPVDVPEAYRSQDYYNTAAILETTLGPDILSLAVHAIEADLGRVRDGVRNSPRTIDIDIIACDDMRSDRSDLRLPHPEAPSRRFVCQPIADLKPDYVLPGQTKTVTEILAALPESPGIRRASEKWSALPYPSGR